MLRSVESKIGEEIRTGIRRKNQKGNKGKLEVGRLSALLGMLSPTSNKNRPIKKH